MSKTVLFRVKSCCNLAHNVFSQSGFYSCICNVALHETKHMFPFSRHHTYHRNIRRKTLEEKEREVARKFAKFPPHSSFSWVCALLHLIAPILSGCVCWGMVVAREIWDAGKLRYGMRKVNIRDAGKLGYGMQES